MIVDRATETVQPTDCRPADLLRSGGASFSMCASRPRALLGKGPAVAVAGRIVSRLTATGNGDSSANSRQAATSEFIELAHDPNSAKSCCCNWTSEGWHLARPTCNAVMTNHCYLGGFGRFGSIRCHPTFIASWPDETFQQYQTVYTRHRGSVAAPTAGLHFTRTRPVARRDFAGICHARHRHVSADFSRPAGRTCIRMVRCEHRASDA